MAEANVVAITPKINFCLKITNISELKEIYSPEYLVQGVPWRVKICERSTALKKSLAAYLYCAKKEKPENWSHAAVATFKLLPFDDDTDPVVQNVDPYVFDNSGTGYGTSSLIKWDDLFDENVNYVEDDTINLDISIEATDPDNVRSNLKLEDIESSTTFHLTVTNIKSLMAVRSTKFNMRNLPWVLMVCKSCSSMLTVRLKSETSNKEISFKVKAFIKLMSSKGDKKSIEVSQDSTYKSSSDVFRIEVISWDKLCEAKNGFVDEDSINMEVEFKMSCPSYNHNAESASYKAVAKPRKLGCSICLETFDDQDVSSTKCGHLFCTDCITESIEDRENCPLCNATVTANDLRSIYLPL